MRGMLKSFGRSCVLNYIDLDLRRGSVMGLIGENGAGRSTMMRCLFGTYQKDEGEIILDGHEVSFPRPKDALENGIAMVHQGPNQYLEYSVVSSLFLGRYPVSGVGIVNEAHVKKEAVGLFRSLGITVNLARPMRNTSVSQRQICETAKAISYRSKIIVLDEPTSSLTEPEVRKLFTMMRKLRDQGISLIYISHKMDKILEICDQVSVFRDGKLAMTKGTSETNLNELITAMIGRSLENHFPPVDNTLGNDVLSIQHLSTRFEPHIQDVTFNVREDEIFGLYDLVGAGRVELLETILDIHICAAGRVYYDGELMNFNPAKEAIERDFASITKKGRASGLFLKGNLTFSMATANPEHYRNGSTLPDQKMVRATSKQFTAMHTKCMGPEDLISSLPGDNRQKVIFGKWLEREPNVFTMNEPAHGIDVDAKYEIYELITRVTKEGKTIIVVSSGMSEIPGITNRIGVMSSSYLSDIVETKGTNQEGLLHLSAKYP